MLNSGRGAASFLEFPMIWRLFLISAAIYSMSGTLVAMAEAPTPKDIQAVQTCLTAKGEHPSDREACIDVVAKPCIGNEGARAPSEIIACFDREQLVWNQLLNDAVGKLNDAFDEEQRTKLRDMQRSWQDTRERTCAFYFNYFRGSMANPMMANCSNRETARRALFLLGFAEDLPKDTTKGR
jgi:uncharacterized protein YecT (DUF1311 family)